MKTTNQVVREEIASLIDFIMRRISLIKSRVVIIENLRQIILKTDLRVKKINHKGTELFFVFEKNYRIAVPNLVIYRQYETGIEKRFWNLGNSYCFNKTN